MATAFRTRTDGLHHAVSMGNIDAAPSQTTFNYTARSYDSEDENMGRLKNRQKNPYSIKPPIYSKEDIIDQYCLTDRQLNNSIEAPRRDRFFGCWSTRSQQSFLGVCVGRRAPSDENLQDYAPINRHPRYQKPISYDDDDLDNSYFRRKPTSFLSSNDSKRHTWMTPMSDDDSARLEASRVLRNNIENASGPYVVRTSYPQKSSFLSQSTEQIVGYRCPAHVNLPSISTAQNPQDNQPRTKHVSFARSLTLASFDDAMGMRQSRMSNARSQERLIGGKKPTLTITQQPPQQISMVQLQTIPMIQKSQLQQTLSQPHIGQHLNHQIIESHNEKQKRNVMKTQATQTEVLLGRKVPAMQTLSLSPRTIHRVKMVSQGAQTNGMNGKKLTKSYSEMGSAVADASCQYDEDRSMNDHEFLHRTQSEDSPKSPLDMSYVKPSGYMMTTAEIHSRASSRQSQFELLRNNNKINDNYYVDPHHVSNHHQSEISFPKTLNDNNAINTRRGSHTLHNEAIFIGRNELEQIRVPRTSNPYEYETHSLPRRTCIHHKAEEYNTHSLPRREHHHHYLHEHSADIKMSNDSINDQISADILHQQQQHQQRRLPAYQDAQPSYVNMNVVADTYSLSRRSSMQQQQVPSVSINLTQPHQQQQLLQQHYNQSLQLVPPSDEMCSTCSSETESETETNEDETETEAYEQEHEEEKEIFIDFKPHLSPPPAPSSNVLITKKKKKLIKAMSEGEILLENDDKNKPKATSASEEDLQLQSPRNYIDNLHYTDTPIRDEDVFKVDNFLNSSSDVSSVARYSRDNFRKRSVSLEETADAEITRKSNKNLKATNTSSTGGSPIDGRSFASSDDITRDHSDGIWNESQVTILPCPPSPPDGNYSSLLTPSKKIKHLPHQQRSSLDADAIDVEDIADQPLPPLPPLPTLIQPQINQQKLPNIDLIQSTTISTTTQTTCLSTVKAATSVASTTTPTGIVKPTPSIAVTHTQSIEKEEKSLINLSQRVKQTSPSKRKDIKKHLQHKNKHTALDRIHRSNESIESSVKTSMESILNRNDVSEGSTTEDYATCTDNSKRAPQAHVPGIRYVSTSKGTLFTASQIPGTTPSSQTITIDGSSFESASSFHSLARVDAICEDIPPIDEKKIPSPVHSDTSSSGSYRMPPMKISSPSKSVCSKPIISLKKNHKKESVSEDERSEKFQSSSHDEKNHKTLRIRKPRDWSEEDRRRKKGNFKLEIEKESSKPPNASSSSSFARTSGALKKISPDDKTALNVLDGTSPSKQKPRFRGKTRKTPRTRTPISIDDIRHKDKSIKTPIIKSPEKPSIAPISIPVQKPCHKTSPLKFSKMCLLSSPSKQPKRPSPITQRLKAVSTESLRSVSPGSDSVFYSEADIIDHQIHCHHCGKEVEVVTAVGGSEESVVIVDDGPDIVQPPEGFADSPNGISSKVPPALKYYKRFRSEDRRHKKGSNGRAKSEERGTEDVTNGKIRGTGSSPCVVPGGPTTHDHHDPEQGAYHGSYVQGSWICITDKDFWRKNEAAMEEKYSDNNNERRNSTDSEKEFKKKYQAITHRLVHRKSCVEMYRRQSSNSFDTDKHVIVQRHSGEFGFRIHGSKPVVVSAIEKDTPAETSGLEVGDIVLSVNSISVVDKSHSEVVKIAHAGSDTLELEVARTINALSPVTDTTGMQSLYSGYLWRKSGQNDTVKWIRRWFCLRPDQCLYYYRSETDIQPLGIILLTNHVVTSVPLEKSSRPFSFTIASTDSKTLTLSADTQDIANGWIAIMGHTSEQADPWLEMCTRNLKLPPSSIVRVDCSGYLMKLGLKWRSWTKRYCILKDACLYFYHESGSKNAIGMVCLQGYRVQPFATGGKKYTFELVPVEAKYRSYYFHTETEMEKKRWVAALEYSIDRWMKAN